MPHKLIYDSDEANSINGDGESGRLCVETKSGHAGSRACEAAEAD